MIRLGLPSLPVVPSYVEALREGLRRGIQPLMAEEEIRAIEASPSAHLEDLNRQGGTVTAPTGETFAKVPHETLWLVEGATFLGEVSFRHELNPMLEAYGGHVGYGIRPSAQGRGLGTLALQLTIERARALGLRRLLVTCAPDNVASERIILRNGGVLENTLPNPYGFGPVKRYWIALDATPEPG